MSIPKVDIKLENGQLGRVDSVGSGYPGLIVAGLSAATEMVDEKTVHPLGQAKMYSSYEEVINNWAGLTDKGPLKVVEKFFEEAPGRELYLMPVADPARLTNFDFDSNIKAMLNDSDDSVNSIGLARLVWDKNSIADAIIKVNKTTNGLMGEYKPISVYLSAKYEGDGMIDLRTTTCNRCGVMVDDSGDYLGVLLGRIAKTSVQRHIGRVKDGAVALTNATIGSSDDITAIEYSMPKVKIANDRKYITLRTYAGKEGYYFTDDPLAASDTDDYSQITLRRVMDKAVKITYATYINEVNNEIPINEDGTIPAAIVKNLQGLIENAINLQMTNSDEISSVSAFIDHRQNVIASEKIEIAVGIVPVGYTKEIEVKLGFNNPNKK